MEGMLPFKQAWQCVFYLSILHVEKCLGNHINISNSIALIRAHVLPRISIILMCCRCVKIQPLCWRGVMCQVALSMVSKSRLFNSLVKEWTVDVWGQLLCQKGKILICKTVLIGFIQPSKLGNVYKRIIYEQNYRNDNARTQKFIEHCYTEYIFTFMQLVNWVAN